MASPMMFWTALPNGRDANGNLQIRAFASPNPEYPPGAPPFLLPNWPQAIAHTTFKVGFRNKDKGKDQTPVLLDATFDASGLDASKDLWTELMGDAKFRHLDPAVDHALPPLVNRISKTADL